MHIDKIISIATGQRPRLLIKHAKVHRELANHCNQRKPLRRVQDEFFIQPQCG